MKHRFAGAKLSNYLAVAVVTLFAGAAIYVAATPRARADDKSLAAGEHIITVYDDGVARGFITKKTTLREALLDAKISIDSNDRTEPALDTKLVASSYQVNIYRARPVVIKDGLSVTKVITAHRTGAQIAKQAGIALRDEDETSLMQSTDPLRDGASEVMTVARALPFTFDFYGKTSTVYSLGKTVGEMLQQKNITLAKNDVVVPGVETPLAAGMHVRLYREGTQTITQEEEVPFETEKIKDANQPSSYKEVKTAGKNGKRTVTYEIRVENGVEISRKEVNSNVTEQPVKQVEVVGTKVSLPAGSHEDWMAQAGISPSDYGYVNYIFTKESGWRPAASNGRYAGLGQTDIRKLAGDCPNWQSDPICQIKVFDRYAVGRYGSWENAYNKWQQRKWW